MAPRMTSSRLGCSALVTGNESPSQPRTAVIQMIWTSLTGLGAEACLRVKGMGSTGMDASFRAGWRFGKALVFTSDYDISHIPYLPCILDCILLPRIALSTDSRQLFPEQRIQHARAADLGVHEHHPRMIGNDFSDDARIVSQRVLPHASHNRIGGAPGHNCDQLAFVGHVKRIQSQNLTGAANRVAYRDLGLAHQHPDFGAHRDLIQYRGHAATGRIAQAMYLQADVQHVGHEFMQGRAVALNHAFKLQVLALRQDGHAVIADVAAQNDLVAWTGAVRRDVYRLLHHPNSCRRDEDLVALAAVHHLGVAGDEFDASIFSRLAHGLHDAAQFLSGKTFFEDEGCSQIERPRTTHGQIVNRSVDGQPPDVATREKQGRDHEGIGGERQARAVDFEHGLVVQLVEYGIAEPRQEHALEELGTQLAAAAVAEHDLLVLRDGQRTLRPR